nr:hypothetical protein [Candidatus Protofrankia datiscae]
MQLTIGAVGAGADGLDKVVEVGQHVGGGQVESGEGTDRGTDLPHHGGGGQPASHDVADDERDPAGGQRNDVEPVTADLGARGAGLVPPGEVQALDLGQAARQKPALQGERGSALAVVGAGVGNRVGDPAAHFGRGLDIWLGVGPPGEPETEEDRPVVFVSGQQRHRYAVTNGGEDVPEVLLPVRMVRRSDSPVVQVEPDGLTHGQRTIRGMVRVEMKDYVRRDLWGHGGHTRRVRSDNPALLQAGRPGVGVQGLVGEEEFAPVGEFRDQELDHPFQRCRQVQRRPDQPAGPAQQPQLPLDRVPPGLRPALLGHVDHRHAHGHSDLVRAGDRVVGDPPDVLVRPGRGGCAGDLDVDDRLSGGEHPPDHLPRLRFDAGQQLGQGLAAQVVRGQTVHYTYRPVHPEDPQLPVDDQQTDRSHLEQLCDERRPVRRGRASVLSR